MLRIKSAFSKPHKQSGFNLNIGKNILQIGYDEKYTDICVYDRERESGREREREREGWERRGKREGKITILSVH